VAHGLAAAAEVQARLDTLNQQHRAELANSEVLAGFIIGLRKENATLAAQRAVLQFEAEVLQTRCDKL